MEHLLKSNYFTKGNKISEEWPGFVQFRSTGHVLRRVLKVWTGLCMPSWSGHREIQGQDSWICEVSHTLKEVPMSWSKRGECLRSSLAQFFSLILRLGSEFLKIYLLHNLLSFYGNITDEFPGSVELQPLS